MAATSRGRLLTATATSDGTRIALRDPGDGQVLAKTDLDLPALRHGIVADDRAAAVLLHDDEEQAIRVAFLDLANPAALEVRWQTEPDALPQELALTSYGLLVRTTTSIELLDRQDGSPQLRHELDQLTRPRLVVDNGQVTIGVGIDTILGLDLISGDETWRYQHDRALASHPTGAGGRTHVIDADGRLLAIDHTGHSTELGRLPDRHTPTGTPLVTQQRIAVPTDQGLLVLRAQP